MTRPDENDPIWRLIDLAVAGEPNQEEGRQLNDRLHDDPAAQQLFLEFVQMQNELEGISRRRVILDEVVRTAEQEVSVPSQAASTPSTSIAGQFQSAIDWRRHKVRFAAFVAGVTAIFWLGFLFFIRPGWQGGEDNRPSNLGGSEIVAQLTSLQNVEWKNERTALRDGAYLTPGRRLELKHGLAEVTFGDGARAVIAGPAIFQVDSRSSGSLEEGKLVGRVSEAARGFAVQAPNALIVDLGTEFGIDVHESGSTDVAVFEGEVEASSGQGASSHVERLVAGQSLRIESSGEMVRQEHSVAAFRQILIARSSATIFHEGFENGPHTVERGKPQMDTGFDLTVNSTYRGWTATGMPHAVDRVPSSRTNWAAMFWHDHSLTSPQIAANAAGKTYQVEFEAGPGVYAQDGQQTTANERLRFEILNVSDKALHQEIYDPEDWGVTTGPGALPFLPAQFTYVGDGTGAIKIRISGATSERRFHGVVDNLRVTEHDSTQ